MECDPVTELQKCLALVRPVGMTDGMARDWLAAAVLEVRHISPQTLARACAEVRKTATHHGQIIPAIIAATQSASKPDPDLSFIRQWERSVIAYSKGYPAIEHDAGGTKQLGDVVKRLGYDE